MKYLSALSFCLCVGGFAQVHAADPPAPPASVETAPVSGTSPAAASTAATTVTSAAPSAATPSTDSAAAASAAQTKKYRAMGYKPETANGITVFCRREAKLGTRFESKVCMSAEDLDRGTKDSQEMTEKIQRNNYYNQKSG